jgi:hypothetical protein
MQNVDIFCKLFLARSWVTPTLSICFADPVSSGGQGTKMLKYPSISHLKESANQSLNPLGRKYCIPGLEPFSHRSEVCRWPDDLASCFCHYGIFATWTQRGVGAFLRQWSVWSSFVRCGIGVRIFTISKEISFNKNYLTNKKHTHLIVMRKLYPGL